MDKKNPRSIEIITVIFCAVVLLAGSFYIVGRGGKSQTAQVINTSPPNDPTIGALTSQQLFDKLIEAGLLTTAKRDEFLAGLTFEDFFGSLTTDQALQALVKYQIVSDSNISSLKSRALGYGVDLTSLRGPGILTALLTVDNGNFHRIISDTRTAYQTLQSRFNQDKIDFMGVISSNEILWRLDGARRTSSSDGRRPIYSYTWSPTHGSYSNLIPVETTCAKTPSQIASNLNGQPAGRRALLIRGCTNHTTVTVDVNGTPTSFASIYDFYNSQGQFNEFDSIWLDTWANNTRTTLGNHLSQIRSAGGSVDIGFADEEDGLMLHGVLAGAKSRITGTAVGSHGQTVWDEIYADSRWPGVAARIGISPQAILSAQSWTDQSLIRRFNAVMNIRMGEYFKTALVDPLVSNFSNAKFSNFNGGYYNQSYPVDRATNFYWHSGEDFTIIPSSVRNTWLGTDFGGFGYFEGFSRYPSDDLNPNNPPWPTPSGFSPSSPTAFRSSYQAFIFDLGRARQHSSTLSVSGPGWLSYKSYRRCAYGPNSGAAIGFGEDFSPCGYGDNHYGEKVFHGILSGGSDYILWNPTDHTYYRDNGQADDQLLNNLLTEVDSMVGYANRYTLSFKPILQTDNYILTCMEAGGKEYCRFTPRLGTDVSNPTSFNISNTNPVDATATFTLINGSTVTPVPGGRIYHPPGGEASSATGFWIVKDYKSYLVTDMSSTVTELLQFLAGTSGPIVTFTATPNPVLNNTPTTLSWTSNATSTCTASGAWSGSKPPSGSFTTSNLTTDQTYNLSCSNAVATTNRSVTVTVLPPNFQGIVLSLSALPNPVNYGGKATFTWSATGATSCTASGGWQGTVPPSGSFISIPRYTTKDYTLTCQNTASTTSKTITLTVTPPPTKPTTPPPPVDTSEVRIKVVGSDLTTGTAPDGIELSIDGQSLPAGTFGGIAGVPVGSHFLNSNMISGYVQKYGTCTFAPADPECRITENGINTPMVCALGTCSATITVSKDLITKIVMMYVKSDGLETVLGTPGQGGILVKHVGSNEYAYTAPKGAGVSLDGGIASIKNPATFSGVSLGSHTVSALSISGYKTSVGSCDYAGTKKCIVSIFTPITCAAGSCPFSAPIKEGRTTKIVFKYTALGGTPSTPPPTISKPPTPKPPPSNPTPTPTPAPKPAPPQNPTGFTLSCLPFPDISKTGDTVVWKAYVVPFSGTYTYSWSGTDGLSGTGSSASKIYTKVGQKTASVTVNGFTKECNKPATIRDY